MVVKAADGAPLKSAGVRLLAEGNAWKDEDFLNPFEDQGTKIALSDEDAVMTNLTVISIKSEGND